LGEKGNGVIATSEAEFRLELDGALIGGAALLVSEEGFEGLAEIVPEFVVVGVQLQALAVDGDGAFEIAEFAAGVAEAVAGIDISGVPAEGGGKGLGGAGGITGGGVDTAQGVVRVGRFRIELYRAAEGFFGRGFPPGLVQKQAEEIVGLALGRGAFEQAAAQGLGLSVAAFAVGLASGL
jgi:hypothetical protein